MVATFLNCIDMHDHQHNNENETKLETLWLHFNGT